MPEILTCPACSGPMQLDEFRPGDKIARCPYCGKVVDLPDGPGGNMRQIFDAMQESLKNMPLAGVEPGSHVTIKSQKRSFSITTTTTRAAKEGDLSAEMKEMVKTLGQSPATRTTVTFRSENGQIPEEAKRILAGMGVPLPGADEGEDEKAKEENTDRPAKKKSWWQRVRGK